MKKGPLDGIVILDLSRVLSGPYCTMILRNLGAKVIKVENLKTGDDSRSFLPFENGISAYSCALNHGKESIALDLKAEPDRKILEELMSKADVLVENFRPGAMDRLGYGWEQLHKKFPSLIYASISGLGHTGPKTTKAGYDLVTQGLSGLMTITGLEGQENETPLKSGIEIADIVAGIFAGVGINAALFDRTRTGKGAYIDISMLDSVAALLVSAIARVSVTNEDLHPTGSRHTLLAPFNIFSTQDKPIIVCCGNDHLFQVLCAALGCPELAQDEKFISNMKRVENVAKLESTMTSFLITKTSQFWLEKFTKEGVPSGPVQTIKEMIHGPQINSRKMIAHFADNFMPHIRFPGNPIKMSTLEDTDSYLRGPNLNEHRNQILKWLEESR
jgi:CoA:oxalate CoA-transferase